jgi:hypothetical protein
MLLLPCACVAQYSLVFSTNDGAITVTGFTGTPVDVTIPGYVNSIGFRAFTFAYTLTNVTICEGVTNIVEFAFEECTALKSVKLPDSLNSIGLGAFINCTNLTSITIPRSVNQIDFEAFADCSNLATVLFAGNAPSADCSIFTNDPVTIYRLPTSSGWDSNFPCQPTVIWNPIIQAAGLNGNQFNLTITGTPNIPIQIVISTDLLTWTPFQTCTLTNGLVEFGDLGSYPSRFYTVRFP